MTNFQRNHATILLGIFLSVTTTGAYGIDIENWGRRAQRHDDWMSISFTDPTMGRMLGTRAGTTDKKTNANFTLTYSLFKECALVETVFIIENDIQGAAIESLSNIGVLQFDNNPPVEIEVKIYHEKGSRFTFLAIKDETIEHALMKGRSLLFNYNGYGMIKFSLSGANVAIKRAKNQCEAFLISETKK